MENLLRQNKIEESSIMALHRLLRKRQAVLDKPTDPAAYQSALAEMVNDLEMWHILRYIFHSISIPWLTLEEGHAYASASTVIETEKEEGEHHGGVTTLTSHEGRPSEPPELTWLG